MSNIMGLDSKGAAKVQAAVFHSILPQNKQTQDNAEKTAKTDRLELSDEAKYRQQVDDLMEQLKSAHEQGDAAGESVKTMSRCMKIAQRIMNGDKVPIKDMKYLQENYPDMMKQALTFRRANPEPKEYKSVLEDEEESGDGTDSGSDTGATELTDENSDIVCGMVVETSGE